MAAPTGSCCSWRGCKAAKAAHARSLARCILAGDLPVSSDPECSASGLALPLDGIEVLWVAAGVGGYAA